MLIVGNHHHHTYSFRRVFDIIPYQQQRYPQSQALNIFRGDRWGPLAIEVFSEQVETLASHLADLPLAKGDKVILAPYGGSPVWMQIDFACQQLGVIVVPVAPDSTKEELELIFSEIEPRLCLVQDPGHFHKFSRVLERLGQEVQVFHLDPSQPGYFSFLRQERPTKYREQIRKTREHILPEDTFTILYTSGTGGKPKGVMLSHDNVVSNIKAILPLLSLAPGSRALSFLPFNHIFERNACYTYLASGVQIYFSTQRDRLQADFRSARPHFCATVPRLLEKMYDLMEAERLKRPRWTRALLHRAFVQAQKDRRPFGIIARMELRLLQALALRPLRWRLGGQIHLMMVGAAALRPELARLFAAIGIQVLEGYGMTETSPAISLNRSQPGLFRYGTAGIPIPGIAVKLERWDGGQEGEILVKGPNVMQGYFNRPQLNREVFTADGWLRTGDVGQWIDGRFLKITDRRKDIFKTSAGKYIAPKPLENRFESSAFIQQALIVGFQRPYVTGLLVPAFSILESWCRNEGIHWTAPPFMIHNIKVVEQIQREVDRINNQLPNFQRMRRFALVDHEWTEESGEMGRTFKKRRKIITARMRKEINRMYAV